jgi:gliding motility-associated-like protein
MKKLWSITCLLIFLIQGFVSFGQKGGGKPVITGQTPSPLSTLQGTPVTITLANLIVTPGDSKSKYPDGYTLQVNSGEDYTVNGTKVTPDSDFRGLLTVRVRVNVGKNKSEWFNLKIDVIATVNVAPQITGQKKLSAKQGTPFSISLSDLTVIDPDNKYPNDFTLEIKQGNNYVVAGSTINPSSTFVGTLNVTVSVSDGTKSSPDFNVQVEIITTKKNVAPTIVGQKAISITQNTSVTLQLFHLEVSDPDNQFPTGFSLRVFPGTNYTVSGTKVTPIAGFVNSILSVGVKVNDGSDDSQLFEVKIQVTPISATPRINGQKELTVMEDNAITITLSDLIVTDADNPNYPKGFSLRVLAGSEGVYSANGNTIRPASNLNGFIEVGVAVNDGVNTSAEFRLAILVTPVNDAPLITSLEASPLYFEPGNEPAEVFRRLGLSDVDSEYLSMAEIGFRETNHSPQHDELLLDYENPKIRAIQDPAGTLFLIGTATVEDYQAALRRIKYNYKVTKDLNGKPEEILSAPRTIYVNVNDGQDVSLTSERTVSIEAKIALDIPSAFTPNGDNANDTWQLVVSDTDLPEQMILKVYNKRGLLVYESGGFEKEWNGMFNGELLPADTYYYTIVVNLPYTRQTYSGVVTILY